MNVQAAVKKRQSVLKVKKTKRIQVTLDVTIPEDWTIGETEMWLYKKLRTMHVRDGWRSKPEVGDQRTKRDA